MTTEDCRVIVRAMDSTFLTRLLPDDFTAAHQHERFRAALEADPALKGRAFCDERGVITLTGPAGGPTPASVKERQRWEMHVRLRLASELGEEDAAGATVRWAGQPDSASVPAADDVGVRYAAP
jgi:hypothetical protein